MAQNVFEVRLVVDHRLVAQIHLSKPSFFHIWEESCERARLKYIEKSNSDVF